MTVYVDIPGPLPTAPAHDFYHEPELFERARLPNSVAATFKNPWLVKLYTGLTVGFGEHEQALRYIRIYRAKNHRHPDTGAKL